MSTTYKCPSCKRDLPAGNFDPRHVNCKTCVNRHREIIKEETLATTKE